MHVNDFVCLLQKCQWRKQKCASGVARHGRGRVSTRGNVAGTASSRRMQGTGLATDKELVMRASVTSSASCLSMKEIISIVSSES